MAVLLCFGGVFWLALLTRDFQSFHSGGDKLNHIVAFFVLAVGLRCFWLHHSRLVFVLLLGYGVLIEVAQSFVGGRQASLLDIVADIVGMSIGLAVAVILCKLVAGPDVSE